MHRSVTEDEELRIVYDAYCDYTRELSIVSTDHTVLKICTDSGLHCKMFDRNRVELALRRHLAKGQKEMDYANFLRFVETEMATPYMIARRMDRPTAVAEIKRKIRQSWPKGPNVAPSDKMAATYHLADT